MNEWIDVTSSTIRSMRYDPEARQMGVIFHNGSEYVYDGIPQEIFDTVRQAPSVGRAFDTYVKKTSFRFTRVR